MPDTPPTATVAGQSVALHVTGYPDVPNRWGSGSIRVASLRLDYGSSISPDARYVFVVGTWVRNDDEVTDASVDRYYDAHDGDMSDWPDWIADLTRKHTPPEARPARGDQFEAWLKTQRDISTTWSGRHEMDALLNRYRLYADTSTPPTEACPWPQDTTAKEN